MCPNGYCISHSVVLGRRTTAHRAAWTDARGVPLKGMMVLHDCDKLYPKGSIAYRRCINLDHLFIGTGHHNQLDSFNKGRREWGTPPVLLGEAHGRALLDDLKVTEIRDLYTQGFTQRELGVMYGITQCHISKIILRVAWSHVA